MFVPVECFDIAPGRYLVNEDGDMKKVDGTILKGCNPKNEQGYIRVSLVSKSGKIKKYAVHRIVLATFVGESDLPIDHINCNKACNKLSNLEYVTSAENQRRAAFNDLYKTGEDNPASVLTNDQVHDICKLLEKGYNIRKIAKKLDLEQSHNMYHLLENIALRKTWRRVSRNYNWDIDDVRLKKYSHEDIINIAIMIQTTDLSAGKIANQFPNYNKKQLVQVIKKMRQGKLYKKYMKEAEGSTTKWQIRDSEGFYNLIPVERD